MLSKTQAMRTPAEYRACLRHSLFNDDGTDKDCTKGLGAFMSFSKDGVELELLFIPAKKMWKKNKQLAEYCFELAAEQLEDEYDNSGYGWDDGDKLDEMKDKSTRYIVVKQDGEPCGFIHFGFTLQGDVLDQPCGTPVLKIFNLNLREDIQRMGVGTRLVQIMEMIARNSNMTYVHALVTNENEPAHSFFANKMKGYTPADVSLFCEVELEDEEELASFTLYSKCLDKSLIQVVQREESASEDDSKLVESIVSMIASGNIGDAEHESDEEEPAEEAV
jgi:ribosomal protein S18 acetylase RimI-like enzyme